MRAVTASRAAAALALGLLLVAGAARTEAPLPASPDRWVTDRAGFLSPATASSLDARLGEYARRTGHQLLVYIDHTTGGAPIEDWAVKAFERWRVGRKGLDDGAVLFVFGDDHKLRIEVGYGLEERVPDAVASRIINERIVPRIRAGDRDGALTSGVDALMAAVGSAGGGAAQAPPPGLPAWQLALGAIVLLGLLGFALTHPSLAWLMLMSIGSGRGGGGWGGGGGAGGGGGFSGGGGRSGGGGASGSW